MNSFNTCCFIGHREINETDKLKAKLKKIIEELIVNKKVDTFLLGSRSEFNDLCQKKPYKKITPPILYNKGGGIGEKIIYDGCNDTYGGKCSI